MFKYFIYSYLIGIWLNSCGKADDGVVRISRQQMEGSQIIFRSFQLLFSRFNQSYSKFFGVAYVLINTTIITFTYEIIVYNSEIHVFVFVLAIINLQLIVGTGFLYQLALGIRDASVQSVSSYQRSGRPQRRVDTAFWKSCYPLEVWIGGLFTVSSRNFILFVFWEIILKTSIDLMLTFPKK